MRMSRALAAGVGSSTTLIGAAAAMLLVVGAIVAFRGDGLIGVFDHATPLFVDDSPPGSGAPAGAAGAAAAPAGAERAGIDPRTRARDLTSFGPTEAGRPRPDGIRHALAGDPATPGGTSLPTSRPRPARGGGSSSGAGKGSPSSSPSGGGSDGGSKPAVPVPHVPAPSLGGTVQSVTQSTGQAVNGVTKEVAAPLAPVSPPLADTVSGTGDTVDQTTTGAGKLAGSLVGG
jgi:hypothetical protein